MNTDRRRDLSGMTFDQWVVTGPDVIQRRNRYWECTCACGLVKFVKAQYLLNGSSKSCVKCSQKPTPYADLVPEAAWNRILLNARRREILVSVSREQAQQLLLDQGMRCALSGLPVATRANGTLVAIKAATASLDRIDSNLGYETGNIQWVHKHVNLMKGVMSQDEFVRMCRMVVSHRGAWNLYGHSHNSLKDDPHSLQLDVGVDAWDYRPASFEEVRERMSKKTFQPVDHHGARAGGKY